MTAKEFLISIRESDMEIRALREKITLLRGEAEGIKAMALSDMPRGGHGKSAADIIAEVADLQRECADQMIDLVHSKSVALETIMRISSTEERAVLIYRYLCGRSWNEIADEMKYAECSIYRIHGTALVDFDKFWKDESK